MVSFASMHRSRIKHRKPSIITQKPQFDQNIFYTIERNLES